MIPILLGFEHFLIFTSHLYTSFNQVYLGALVAEWLERRSLEFPGAGFESPCELWEAEDNFAWFGVPHQGFLVVPRL